MSHCDKHPLRGRCSRTLGLTGAGSVVLVLAAALVACRAKRPTPAKPPATTSAAATARPPAEAGSSTLLGGPTTFAVIAGVLSFADPSVAPFSSELRKDRELAQVLSERGVSRENMAVLLDEDATVAAIRTAVERLSAKAGPGATLLFYYAGHGARDDDGAPYFLAHDTRDAAGGLVISALARHIAERFGGSRVVLMADCCYSGALQDAAKTLARRPGLATAALTSADASNLSTGNWTFTQTVIDGLRGDWAADANADGIITLGELSSEVAAAMKHRERQRHGFALHGVEASTQIAKAGPRPSSTKTDGPPLGDYFSLERERTETVRVREVTSAGVLVRLFHYNQARDERVPAASLSPIRFERHEVGEALRVYWGGKIWDARVVDADGDFFRITYPGWPTYWDEWILSDRVASSATGSDPARAKVEVEWRGRWYPAVVLRREGSRSLIHYDGYDDSWDEWVGPERIRRLAP